MRKLLIIETITWKPHIETAMEIALRELDSGTNIHYYSIRDGLPSCEDKHPIHKFIDLPKTRTQAANALLGSRVGIEHRISGFSAHEMESAAKEATSLTRLVKNNQDFSEIKYKDFHDIGWGALSSAITARRDSTLSYQHNSDLLNSFLISSIMIFDRVIRLIETINPEKVLLFNGRFATTRPVMRAAEHCGVPWLIHERGRDKNHYWLTDYQPHDYVSRQEDMKQSWEPAFEGIAREFFTGRRNRIERDWHSFTKNQKAGKLPTEMRGEGEWVTFFTSSDDELLAIGDEFKNPYFPTQRIAIAAVHEILQKMAGLNLCIRIHPHIAKKSRRDRSNWERLDLPDTVIVGPSEDFDTYAIIERSKVVVSYGSTVGVEATYWQRPSMLMGPSFYDSLNVAQLVRNKDEIFEFLENPRVFPTEGALIYGAHFRTFGTPFEYYEAGGLHHGEILGTNLDNSFPMRVIRRLRAIGGGSSS